MRLKTGNPAAPVVLLLGVLHQTGADSAQRVSTQETPRPSGEAQIVQVDTRRSGAATDVTFAVTVRSPDTGCDRYADWWEVITPEGELLYRRILTHSHVDEQPFTRSGGPVTVDDDREVLVRLHMSPDGYSRNGARGSVLGGFETEVLAQIAGDLEHRGPLPDDCRF